MNALSVKQTLRHIIYVFLLLSHLMAILLIMSCGRRGDPFLPSPHDISKEDEHLIIKEKKATQDLSGRAADVEVKRPDAPTGLFAVFTGESVVLSWNDIEGQGIVSYMIYRDDGNGFAKYGETVVPAFIDEKIKMKSMYRYRVTAKGKSESKQSIEIEIRTEDSK